MKPVFLFLAFFIFITSCQSRGLVTIQINKHSLNVEVARTPEERALGLMNRRHLPANQGMLFIFKSQHHPAFWMKNTHIPLSIAFIDADATIKQIEKMQPHSLASIASRHSVLYALEVNSGWFQTRGIKPGSKVRFLKNFQTGQ